MIFCFPNNVTTTTGSTSATTGVATTGFVRFYSSTSSTNCTVPATQVPQVVYAPIPWRNLVIPDQQSAHITLPDGTKIDVAKDGSFELKDHDAKVIYRAARVRDFNPFINASDKIEEFIRFCGEHGVRQDEMLDLPVKLFIGWLIIEAAKADREPDPNIPLIPDLRRHTVPRCVGCGRFIRRSAATKGLMYCRSDCFDRHEHRASAAISPWVGPSCASRARRANSRPDLPRSR